MKRNISILTGIFFLVVISGIRDVKGQRLPEDRRLKNNSDLIVRSCYAGNNPRRIYIPPPEQFYKSQKTKNGSIFNVKFVGFTEEAKTSFLYALDIWASLLETPVDINILVKWYSLGSNTLGSTYINPYHVVEGMELGAPEPNALYPYPIAEKMAGEEINEPNAYEIEMTLNKDAEWYFGTDGNAEGKYDLVTVSLHEMGHGLGFHSTMEEYNGGGIWGYVSGRTIYFDHFIKNAIDQQLIDTTLFENGSAELLEQYLSNKLYFKSSIARSVNGGINPKLFAPTDWRDGSSISHLDENTFPGEGMNSLMTPYINKGEAIHNPGPIVMAMFAEIGWIHTYIDHDTLMDAENLEEPFTITAKITSDTTITSSGKYVYYSTNGFATYDSIMLAETMNPDEYAADIPVSDTGIYVSYYLTATDCFDRVYRKPVTAPEVAYRFYIGKDNVKPVIEHKPLPYMLISEDSLKFIAEVSDNLGVDSVYIDYLVNEAIMEPVTIPVVFESTYQGYLDFDGFTLAVGDTISYRIVAVDASVSGNTTILPNTGYYTFRVEKINDPVDAYENDFNGAVDDFLKNSFYIQTPNGFDDPALHTLHPYEQTGVTNKSLDYEAILTYPITLRETDALMRFKEIVLVEPGEPGTVFGNEEFWDYVVVEGSKDTGSTWYPLYPGYDSRVNSLWLTAYNSTIQDGNSLASGALNMYRERTINLVAEDEFSAGDEVLIRFRLFSDAFAWGWGWVIDDLQIQGDLSGTGKDLFMDNDVLVFPNPASGIITLEGELKQGISDVNVIITDILGREIIRKHSRVTGETFRERIDLSEYDSGIYLITLSSGDRTTVLKIIKSD